MWTWIDYSQTSFSYKNTTKLCRILYGKLTKIDKQSHNSTFSTLSRGDHAPSEHVQKYHDCSQWLSNIKGNCNCKKKSLSKHFDKILLSNEYAQPLSKVMSSDILWFEFRHFLCFFCVLTQKYFYVMCSTIDHKSNYSYIIY